MEALVVGSDSIGALVREAAALGVEITEHWPGRKTSELRRQVPRRVGVIMVLCNFVSHEMVRHARDEAERLGIPVLYSRSSLRDAKAKLEQWVLSAAA
jgi:hypothetical protein